MISYIRSKNIIKIEDVWFATKTIKASENVDIISYVNSEIDFKYKKSQRTLVNNLKLSEEELMKKIHKNTRYEIKRADREGIECYFVNKNMKNLIDDFIENYMLFLKEKSLPLIHENDLKKQLYLIAEQNALAITTAELNEKVIVWHVYIYDKNVTRLMYSISHFRTDDSKVKIQVGMANRLLHWKDFLYFKKK